MRARLGIQPGYSYDRGHGIFRDHRESGHPFNVPSERQNYALVHWMVPHTNRVPTYKYLGIWIDEKLSFKKHIDELVQKRRIQMGFFFLLSFDASRYIAKSRSFSQHSCRFQIMCDNIYVNAAANELKPLDVVYHSTLLQATGSGSLHSVSESRLSLFKVWQIDALLSFCL